MDPREYELMYHVEEHHWWYRGMAAITRSIIDRWIQPASRLKILDAGCGTGAAMATYLSEYGEVTGVDLYQEALEFCRRRNMRRIARASILGLPFGAASFELVTSFDVLYERAVISDLAALKEFARVLVPSGRVLLRLPAYDWLRGQHDERVHTSRRYTKKRVNDLLEAAGFEPEHLSYANTFLFPIALIKRLGEKFLSSGEANSDLSLSTGGLNRLLATILAWEAPLIVSTSLPYGLSVVAVGRKRS